MKVKNIILMVLFCLYFQSLLGQETGFYFKYDFHHFLETKSTDKEKYLQNFKKNLRYPPISRENNLEGALEFLVISSGNDELELILRTSKIEGGLVELKNNQLQFAAEIFKEAVQKVFEETNAKFLKENKEKYLTSFTVLFDMLPFEKDKRIYKQYDFVIQGDEIKLEIKHSHQSN